METSKRSKNKVAELARRFTEHSPQLCREHMPDGLPIDAPEGVENISPNHPSYKFEKIVEEEAKGYSTPDEVARAKARAKLREVFAMEYYSHGDELSCVECYDNRKETDGDVPIRMDLPDNWDEN